MGKKRRKRKPKSMGGREVFIGVPRLVNHAARLLSE
jgi:hypothetical protein